MVDDQNSNDIPANNPIPDQDPQTSETPEDEDEEHRIKRRRPVYEPTLFKDKKKFTIPRWLAGVVFAAVCAALVYFLIIVPRQRAHFVTVGQVVFSADPGKTGLTHLYLVNADGTGLTQVTKGNGSDSQPAFAPDGNQIAFVSNQDDPTKQLYCVNPNGKERTQLTRTVGVKGAPAYAPGSYNMIAYTDAGVLEVLDMSSNSATRLLPPTPKKGADTADTLAGANIGKTITNFAWAPGTDVNKEGIAAVEETNGEDRLILQPTLDSDPILSTDGTPEGPPLMLSQSMSLAWSPDGKTIAVAALGVEGIPNGGKLSGIFFVDGTTHQPSHAPVFMLKSDVAGPQSPVFSPDGARVVCQLIEQPDITKTIVAGLGFARMDGSRPPSLAIHGQASEPKFSPDGHYLYFLGARPDGGHDLVQADMTKGVLKRLSDGTADVTGYDISPQQTK